MMDDILLADETTGNLDSEMGKCIIELLETLNEETVTTIISVIHYPYLALLTRRKIKLKAGKNYGDRS